MLTRRDLRWIYSIFKLASILSIFPVSFDPRTRQMKVERSIWKKIVFKTWHTLSILHFFYVTLRTFQLDIFSSSSPYRDFLPMMGIISSGICVISMQPHLMFIHSGEENVKVYNQILRNRGNFSLKILVTCKKLKLSTE